MKAYIILHKFAVICLSETYLDSTTPTHDDKLQIPGYTYVHPCNTKPSRVCIYYRSYLLLRVINIDYLHECLSFELQIWDKICNFVALYRSSSQFQDDFETFADNLKMTLEILAQNNPFLITAIGNINTKSTYWYNKDKTTFKGNTIDNITSQLGFHQLINESTHILQNSNLCIDLIFMSQPKLVIESCVHSSLHSSCPHQIVFPKFNLKICYTPPYS